MTAPRVTATHTIDPVTDRRLSDPNGTTTPHVELTVTYDLGDHRAARDALDTAIDNVMRQISRTAIDAKRTKP